MFKTVVIESIRDIGARAQAIESKANEMFDKDYVLVSTVTSKKCQTILVFKSAKGAVGTAIQDTIVRTLDKLKKSGD